MSHSVLDDIGELLKCYPPDGARVTITRTLRRDFHAELVTNEGRTTEFGPTVEVALERMARAHEADAEDANAPTDREDDDDEPPPRVTRADREQARCDTGEWRDVPRRRR